MIAETAEQADSISGKTPKNVLTSSGNGRSRTVIFVAIPKVPSDPINVPLKSYPGMNLEGPPICTIDPSSSTTSLLSTWLVVVP